MRIRGEERRQRRGAPNLKPQSREQLTSRISLAKQVLELFSLLFLYSPFPLGKARLQSQLPFLSVDFARFPSLFAINFGLRWLDTDSFELYRSDSLD
jgi:hypothetical protein